MILVVAPTFQKAKTMLRDVKAFRKSNVLLSLMDFLLVLFLTEIFVWFTFTSCTPFILCFGDHKALGFGIHAAIVVILFLSDLLLHSFLDKYASSLSVVSHSSRRWSLKRSDFDR